MTRFRSAAKAPKAAGPAVVEVPVPDSVHAPLVVIRGTDPIWSKDADAVSDWAVENAGSIVWLEPPPDYDAGWVVDALARGGCAVKQIAARKPDRVVPEAVAEVAAPSNASIREVVGELCDGREVPASIRDAVREYCFSVLGSEGA